MNENFVPVDPSTNLTGNPTFPNPSQTPVYNPSYQNQGSNPVNQGQPNSIPINSDQGTVTTIVDLQSYSKGIVVRFPDFAHGQPLIARVCRPSLLLLVKQGKIPNSLLKAASELFTSGKTAGSSGDMGGLDEMYDIVRIVCKSCLLSPTLDEIESVGLTLSDEQMMSIFNYTQIGIKALSSFRSE